MKPWVYNTGPSAELKNTALSPCSQISSPSGKKGDSPPHMFILEFKTITQKSNLSSLKGVPENQLALRGDWRKGRELHVYFASFSTQALQATRQSDEGGARQWP